MEQLPDSNSRYKDVDYWDERYKLWRLCGPHEESFEWFGNFKHILELHVRKQDGILVLCCGNSSMSSDMHSCGFTSITNIDYSAVCIKAMAARHRGCPGMDWRQMDARLLTFAEGSFDVVLEKETLNAMMVEEKEPWRVSPETGETVRQVSRVLKPGGRFISITFAQPHFRKQRHAWEEFGWSVRHDAYGSGFHYFLYVMIKGEALSPEE
ncbi:EEF1A lysine methyltransferase 4-like [Acipenser ruthenus]|uniref:EEF1A lysine methyltransferase 4-like n=1 Tax=Acipenser ruthenus TaxID=7906 RepID=UPI002742422D|nr:EEF1A lysine methyltransferase 4-like [Acipenser ruthenus]